ncbi:hypothetical protein [Photobacterium rosenbergii]|uniref:Uncharacterized protein n=1 Tax=Photobacterium rosenbergii TaxID=294936 RepID=A0ABU3ZQJ1_9GAMM|nr:hypothetical protein [Photobacterium rosenbergii]MDV5172354.1 hypothetical protein [Photobacterium rosenbergii]
MWRLAAFSSLVAGGMIAQGVQASEWYVEPRVSIAASYRLHGSETLTSQVNAAGLKLEYYGDSLSLNFDGELQYDAVFDWNNQYSREARDEYGTRGWIDEAYLSWGWNMWSFYLGYQKVVWGEADDLRVTDVVNPLDLKDFVLFDIDDYRISQPMLRTESTLGDWDVELLWVFESEPNQLAASGSEFAMPVLDGIPLDEPSGSEFGFRFSTILYDADASFYGFSGYQDDPVLVSGGGPLAGQYYNQRMLGNSLSFSAGDFIFRTELAWFYQQSYGTLSFEREKHNTTQGLLGIDYLYRDWLITGQVSDRYISGWQSQLAVPESDAIYTLSAEGSLFASKLTARFAASYADSNGGGGLYQMKLSYVPASDWKMQFNVDLLNGEKTNFFGQYKSNDRVWVSTTYYF